MKCYSDGHSKIILRDFIFPRLSFTGTPGGGGTSLWVRRGCAPVLGSFWPENSGIGVSFYWKISVIGVYFHSEFSGIGVYCYTQILYEFSSYT